MTTIWRPETPVLFVSTRDARLSYYAYYYEEIMKQITDQATAWGARTPVWYKYFKLDGYDVTKSETDNITALNVPNNIFFSQPSYYRNDPKPIESFRMVFTPLDGGAQQLVKEVAGRNNGAVGVTNKFWTPDYILRNYYWDIVEYLARYINTMNVSLTEKQKSDNWCLLERWGIGGSGTSGLNGNVELYKSWSANVDRSGSFSWGGWGIDFSDWHNAVNSKNFQLYKDYTDELPRFETTYFEKILDTHLDLVRPRWVLTFPKDSGIGVIDIFSAEYSNTADLNHLIHDGNLRDQNINTINGIKFILEDNDWIMSNAGHIRTFSSRGEALLSSSFPEEIPAGDTDGYAIYSGLNSATSAIFVGTFPDVGDAVVYVRGGSLYVRGLPIPPATAMGAERGPIKIRTYEPTIYGSELFPLSTEEIIIADGFESVSKINGWIVVKDSNGKYWSVNEFIADPDPNDIYIDVDAGINIDIAGKPAWRPSPTFFKGQVKNEDGVITVGATGFPSHNLEIINSSFARNISTAAIEHYEAQTLVKAYDDRIAGMYNDRVGIWGSGDFIDSWVLRTFGYPQPWAVRSVLAYVDATTTVDDSNIGYWRVGLAGYEASFYDVEYRRVYRFTFDKWWDADKLRPLNCAINLRYPTAEFTPGFGPHCQAWLWDNSMSIKAFTRNSGIISPTDWDLGSTVFSVNLGVGEKIPKVYKWFNFDIPIALEYGKDLIVICKMNNHSREYFDSDSSGTGHWSNVTSGSAILSYAGDPEIAITSDSGYGNNDYGDDYGN